MPRADQQHDHATIEAAAAELDGIALDVRMSSSIGGRGEQWDSPTDKAAHDKYKKLSAKLYALNAKAHL